MDRCHTFWYSSVIFLPFFLNLALPLSKLCCKQQCINLQYFIYLFIYFILFILFSEQQNLTLMASHQYYANA